MIFGECLCVWIWDEKLLVGGVIVILLLYDILSTARFIRSTQCQIIKKQL